MGKYAKEIVGGVMVIAGFYIGNPALVRYGYMLIASGALDHVASLFVDEPRRRRAGVEIEYWGTVEPRRLVYGTQQMSGMNTIPPWTSGDNNQFLHQILTLAGHEVEEIGDVYFGKIKIDSDNIAAIATSPGTADEGKVTAGTYVNRAWIRRYTGTSTQNADYILTQISYLDWDANYRGRGVAYIALQYQFDQGVYRTGRPEVTAVVKGAKVYDPRLDTSPGANPTSASYIAWSDNPALCLTHYLLSEQLGVGEDATRIDWGLVVAAANVCDEDVMIPGSTTQKRYTCNIVLEAATNDEERRENIKALVGAMMGHIVYRGGKWRMYAGCGAASSMTIGVDDVIGRVTIRTDLPGNEKYNFVRGQYVDAARNYQLSEFNPRSNSAYETADGDRKPREVIFYACDNEYEAQRNATVVLKRSRLRKSCTLQLGLSCYKLRPWDVVTVNLPTLGLSNQLMRCIEWQFNQDGYIEAQFLEEDNTTWNDPDVSDYTVSTDPTNPTSDNFIPYPPTSLTATGVTDGIVLSWEADTRQLPTMYRVYQDSVATGYTDSPMTATLVTTTPNTSVTIPRGTTDTAYYWVTAYDASSGNASEAIPDGDGVSAAATAVTAGFRVALSKSSVSKTLYLVSSGTSSSVSSTVTGGTAPYTYSWARTSGSADITANTSTASSTTFSVTGLSNLQTKSATFVLTVSDNASPRLQTTASVYVSFYRNDYGAS